MKNFMKKAAAAMIAMLAVVAVFGTSVPAQAASKARKVYNFGQISKACKCKQGSYLQIKQQEDCNRIFQRCCNR